MHITSLGYLDERLPQFTKLLDSGNEESNRWLVGINAAIFYDKDEEKSLKIGLSNLELERIWKKQAKV